MSISSISQLAQQQAAQTPGGGEGGAGQRMSETFDQFLTLLTTQMQNQDPLKPMDSEKFTEQLVQFSSVEQALQTNQKLDELIGLQGGNLTTQAVGYIGKEIEVEGDQLTLAGGKAPFAYELDGAADKVEVVIEDAQGRTVRRLSGETADGRHAMTWDGQSATGEALPDGAYRITVAAVRGDEAAAARAFGFARVTGVESGPDGVKLEAGGASVDINDVRSVRLPDAPTG